MDEKSTFLNGVFKKEVYVDQPPEFEVKGKEHKVYKLKKELYGVNQSPRAWYSCIDSYFLNYGFNKYSSEPNIYIKMNNQGNILIVCLYVVDLICMKIFN